MSETTERPRQRGWADHLLNIGLVVAVLVGFVAWRRARDPNRMWAKRVSEEHARQIDQPLRRCFGAPMPADLRRLITSVRAGQMPPPFNDCHRGPMVELMVAPNGFIEVLRNPPTEVYRLRDRHRASLLRFASALRLLEHEVTVSAGNPDAARREALVRRLDDLLPELEAERRAFEDLTAGARDTARWF